MATAWEYPPEASEAIAEVIWLELVEPTRRLVQPHCHGCHWHGSNWTPDTWQGGKLEAELHAERNCAYLRGMKDAQDGLVGAGDGDGVRRLLDYIGRAKRAAGDWYITGRPLEDVITDIRRHYGEEV